MSDTISQIQVNDTVYEICDVKTRNDITAVQELVNNFLYDRFWRPAGDINLRYSGAGYITESSTKVIVTVPINNGAIDIERNPSITWNSTSSSAAFRYNNKYLWGDQNGRWACSDLTITTSSSYIYQNVIVITFAKSSAYSNATNNSPVGVDIMISGTLSYGS